MVFENKMDFATKWALLASNIEVVTKFINDYTLAVVGVQGKRIGLSWSKIVEAIGKAGGNAEIAEAMKFTLLTQVPGHGEWGKYVLWYVGTAPKSLDKKAAPAGDFVPEA